MTKLLVGALFLKKFYKKETYTGLGLWGRGGGGQKAISRKLYPDGKSPLYLLIYYLFIHLSVTGSRVAYEGGRLCDYMFGPTCSSAALIAIPSHGPLINYCLNHCVCADPRPQS